MRVGDPWHDALMDRDPGTPHGIAIEGDATRALATLGVFSGAVDLIAIDPPYNTASRFYHYDDSRSSDDWLADRLAHLEIARDLLSERGSVWIHIDDSELHALKLGIDRLFGRRNYVATIVWQKVRSRDNRTAISTSHEYLLVYAKNRTVWNGFRKRLRPTDEQVGRYSNPDGDPRGPWTSGDFSAKAGPGRRGSQFYEIVTPTGRVVAPAAGNSWRFTEERYRELLADGRIWFGPTGNNVPRLKRFLSEVSAGLVPTTWWPGEEVGTNATAKKQLLRLFPGSDIPFDTPKPEELLARIIDIATEPGSLVLDFYAGSGTTAAVAHKTGRDWIVIEQSPFTFRDVLVPRIQAVVEGETGGISANVGWRGGGTFEVRSDDTIRPADLEARRPRRATGESPSRRWSDLPPGRAGAV